MIVETYSKLIQDKEITVTVERTNNVQSPYIATSSYKGILGYGQTLDEAKKSCESAVKMDIIMN